MSPTDKPAFSALLSGCLQAIYDKPVSVAMLDIWFRALDRYPLDELADALGRHVTDPDHGQFPPKPADLVRALDGGSDGRALAAWTRVDKAIRHVGGWRSVCFDDPLIHVCVDAMGGWVALCETKGEELPYRQQEFAKRYRALMLSRPAAHPGHLVGRFEAENGRCGYPIEPPLLMGDPERAQRVMLSGSRQPGPVEASHLAAPALVALSLVAGEAA